VPELNGGRRNGKGVRVSLVDWESRGRSKMSSRLVWAAWSFRWRERRRGENGLWQVDFLARLGPAAFELTLLRAMSEPRGHNRRLFRHGIEHEYTRGLPNKRGGEAGEVEVLVCRGKLDQPESHHKQRVNLTFVFGREVAELGENRLLTD
jgi:hypothetical protein